MSTVGFWLFLPLLKHPSFSSVYVISGTGDSSLQIPFLSEPQIYSTSSLLYAEQGEATGVCAADLRHLPDPKEDDLNKKLTKKLLRQ